MVLNKKPIAILTPSLNMTLLSLPDFCLSLRI